MFLIDDDQAKLGEWQEQRRTCTTTTRARPSAMARQVVAARALFDTSECHSAGAAPKRQPEAVEPLRTQRDLGQQHQHLTPHAGRRGDRGEIGLGLARAGHAVEERSRKIRPRAPVRPDASAARCLVRRQRRTLGPRQSGIGSGGRLARYEIPRRRWPAAIRPRTTPAPQPARRAVSAIRSTPLV